MNAEQIRQLISAAFACQHLEVLGEDGQHFFATIVSTSFAGLSRVARHQAVYRALGSKMGGDIHALSMRTLTPEEWQAQAAA